MNKQNKILFTDNLSIGYKSKENKNVLLENLNLEIESSELICAIGPNGCGKSTLLRTLSGLQDPLYGSVFINGKKTNSYDRLELAKNLSVVLTESNINNLSLLSIVGMGRYPYINWKGKFEKKDKEIINDVISKTGLEKHKYKNISQVSDGTRQKAMIARALAQDTPLIILDEPTAFLDIPSKLEIMHLLKNLAHNFNKAIILSTHDLDLALQIADKIWLINTNNEIFVETPEEMVLNGHFENVFNRKEIKFIKEKGIFKFSSSENINIKVSGNSVEKFWTDRALERLGYKLVESDSEIEIIVDNVDKPIWIIKNKNQSKTFNSINSLTNYLKTIDK